MTPEFQRPNVPDWALRERRRDLEWIGENLHIFGAAARSGFDTSGRGALVVDVTVSPSGLGNPFGYVPQEVLESAEDEDLKRMLRGYDTAREFVVVVLKNDNRTSMYRVAIRPADPPRRTG